MLKVIHELLVRLRRVVGVFFLASVVQRLSLYFFRGKFADGQRCLFGSDHARFFPERSQSCFSFWTVVTLFVAAPRSPC